MSGAAAPPASPSNLAAGDVLPEVWCDATTNKFIWTDDLPRGIQAYATGSAFNTAISAGGTITALSLPAFTFLAGRLYRITGGGSWNGAAASATQAQLRFWDGTTLHAQYQEAMAGGMSQAHGLKLVTYASDTALTWTMRVTAASTNGISWNVDSTNVDFFYIEDVGKA